jgi:two-component system sensor histidine kinase TtrS
MAARRTPAGKIVGACLLGILTAFGHANIVCAQTEMSIGVLAFRGQQDALERWQPTARYLSKRIADHHFTILPLTLEGMLSRVENDQLDFILTNTGNYVVLENAYGISRLATLKVLHLGEEFTQFGAAIFTRRDHPELNQIEDIAGHSLMAVSSDAFGGFQMAWRELIDAGIDPFEDLASLQFSGFPQDDIVHAVIAGKVDVGTVRSGTLERMAAEKLIDIDDIKLLGARKSDALPFLHSTRLYPEWPFAKARKTPERLAQRVAIALLELEPDSTAAVSAFAAGWTIPLDYGPVHELFRELQIGPYAYPSKPSLLSIWREYKGWIIFSVTMIVLLFGLLILIGRANRRISQSEAKFREEAEQRRQAQELLVAHKANLEIRVRERTVELADVNSSLRRSESTLRAMHDITTDPDTDFDAKLQSLLAEGCRFFGMQFAIISNTSNEISCRVTSGADDKPEQQLVITERLRSEIRASHKPVSIVDFKSHSFADSFAHAADLNGSAIGAEYQVDDEIAGYILFGRSSSAERSFSDVDIDILQLMAQWLGGEVERSEIFRRAQEHQAHLAHVARLNTMGEMATGIAHELNQPLTAILNYSNGGLRLLQRQGETDSVVHDALNGISKDARRAAGIIRRLREFIKRGEHRPERFSLRDCIEPAVELLRPRLIQNRIEVAINYTADMPEIVADRIQIEQVVVNLVLNAVDALQTVEPTKRKIYIAIVETENGQISVAISDTAGKLEEKVISHLFDPFFTTKSEGMGMGLSISRSIVEAHGGTIEYLLNDSQQTTFRFTLPLT